MWKRLVNWFKQLFRDERTDDYHSLVKEKNQIQALYRTRTVEIENLKATSGLKRAEYVKDLATQFSKTYAAMRTAFKDWSASVWLRDYFFASTEDKASYTLMKTTLDTQMQRVSKALRKLHLKLLYLAESQPSKFGYLLPENTPLYALFNGMKQHKAETSDDAAIRQRAQPKSQHQSAKAWILRAIEGEYPASMQQQQRYAKAIYLIELNGCFHEAIEDPQNDAETLLSHLVKKQYYPAMERYARLLWSKDKDSKAQAIGLWQQAAEQGSIVAKRTLAKHLLTFIKKKIANKTVQYPSCFDETDFHNKVIEHLIAVRDTEGDVICLKHIERLSELSEQTLDVDTNRSQQEWFKIAQSLSARFNPATEDAPSTEDRQVRFAEDEEEARDGHRDGVDGPRPDDVGESRRHSRSVRQFFRSASRKLLHGHHDRGSEESPRPA